MGVCRFFLKGHCTFGDRCWNEHATAFPYPRPASRLPPEPKARPVQTPAAGHSDADAKTVSINAIKEDLSPGEGKPSWLLSSYGLYSGGATLIRGLDESPEEIRLMAWHALKSGEPKQMETYKAYERNKFDTASTAHKNALDHPEDTLQGARRTSPIPQSSRTTPTSAANQLSAYEPPSRSPSPFGSHSQLTPEPIEPSKPIYVLGQPDLNQETQAMPAFDQATFGQIARPTAAFGQISQSRPVTPNATLVQPSSEHKDWSALVSEQCEPGQSPEAASIPEQLAFVQKLWPSPESSRPNSEQTSQPLYAPEQNSQSAPASAQPPQPALMPRQLPKPIADQRSSPERILETQSYSQEFNRIPNPPLIQRSIVTQAFPEPLRGMQKRRELMTLVNSLRSLGAQVEVDLPRIVCIGNQSVGKSSIIEAISGIRVPRSSGICTRCPMEFRTSSAGDSWTARISLRVGFDSAGNRLPQAKSYCFGPTITDPNAVEPGLRRAQSAILNWGNPSYDEFLTVSEATLTKGNHLDEQMKFSRNVVCIEVSGPTLADLVFVDLPGLIQNADEDTISLVETMVMEQIEGNSIILLILPMNDDLENQKAALLAKTQDPQGLRTIGVLTKPDMLTTGAMRSQEAWLDVIEGRKHQLMHGYYCIRQPEDSDRAQSTSFDAACRAEAEFFKDTLPWSTSFYRERFGIWNFRERLSAVLSQKINEMLSKLHSDVKTMLKQINAQLAAIQPPLASDPSTELLNLLVRFCTRFSNFADGTCYSERLVQENRQIYQEFRHTIRCTVPVFQLSEHLSPLHIPTNGAFEVVDDETLPEGSILVCEPMSLVDIRARIGRSITRELPNNVPSSVKFEIIDRFTTMWRELAMQCLSAIHNQVNTVLMGLLTEYFGRFPSFKTHARVVVAETVESHRRKAEEIITILIGYEHRPFTQNERDYGKYREKFIGIPHFKNLRSRTTLSRGNASSPAVFSQDTASLDSTEDPGPNPISDVGIMPQFVRAPSEPPLEQDAQLLVDTCSPPYQETLGQDGFGAPDTRMVHYVSITCMQAYCLHSFEELRVADYQRAKKSSGCPTQPSDTYASQLITSGTQIHQRADPTNGFQGCSRTDPRTELTSNFHSSQLQSEALMALARLGLHITAQDLEKLIPGDGFDAEITVAAEVRAFFQVAHKSIFDIIPKTIDNIFLCGLADDMLSSLGTKLVLGNKESAAEYLSEDPTIVTGHEELLRRKALLENIRDEIFNFGL